HRRRPLGSAPRRARQGDGRGALRQRLHPAGDGAREALAEPRAPRPTPRRRWSPRRRRAGSPRRLHGRRSPREAPGLRPCLQGPADPRSRGRALRGGAGRRRRRRHPRPGGRGARAHRRPVRGAAGGDERGGGAGTRGSRDPHDARPRRPLPRSRWPPARRRDERRPALSVRGARPRARRPRRRSRRRRPGRLAATLEERARTITRHSVVVRLRTAVRTDGTLLARECDVVLDTGAYADIGPRVATKAGSRAPGPYRIPCLRIDARCVYTNNVPAGAYRGYGVPQVTWASESQIDVIAERLGIDPFTLRERNLLKRGEEYVAGDTPLDGDMADGLGQAARALGWGA